jgi:hypothetical protein
LARLYLLTDSAVRIHFKNNIPAVHQRVWRTRIYREQKAGLSLGIKSFCSGFPMERQKAVLASLLVLYLYSLFNIYAKSLADLLCISDYLIMQEPIISSTPKATDFISDYAQIQAV